MARGKGLRGGQPVLTTGELYKISEGCNCKWMGMAMRVVGQICFDLLMKGLGQLKCVGEGEGRAGEVERAEI
jgi:hypothetical protein